MYEIRIWWSMRQAYWLAHQAVVSARADTTVTPEMYLLLRAAEDATAQASRAARPRP